MLARSDGVESTLTDILTSAGETGDAWKKYMHDISWTSSGTWQVTTKRLMVVVRQINLFQIIVQVQRGVPYAADIGKNQKIRISFDAMPVPIVQSYFSMASPRKKTQSYDVLDLLVLRSQSDDDGGSFNVKMAEAQVPFWPLTQIISIFRVK